MKKQFVDPTQFVRLIFPHYWTIRLQRHLLLKCCVRTKKIAYSYVSLKHYVLRCLSVRHLSSCFLSPVKLVYRWVTTNCCSTSDIWSVKVKLYVRTYSRHDGVRGSGNTEPFILTLYAC